MGELHGEQLTVFLLGLAVLLGCAHMLGEIARRFGQPIVIGEMLAGLLLGPTLFGWIAPEAQSWLFPHDGAAAIALDGIVMLAVTLLLLVAGMEVDLSSALQRGKAAAIISAASVVVPLVAGSAVAWMAPHFWGMPADGNPRLFAIFFGTALCVSALPVIAKVLLDLDLFQSDVGVLVLTVATLTNLMAWLFFSVVLSGAEGTASVANMILLTIGFAVAMLTVGRWVADQCLRWVQAHLPWPSGILGFALVAGLLGGAVTEWIGIHAIFGAFLTGIALGESPHMREQTRHIVHRFVEGVLAPVFVAAIGLEVNFVTNFRIELVLGVLALGIAVKVLAVWAGARLAGCPSIEAWGTGWALNARGELGIVLGLLAWESGLIRERLFVAIVTLAVVTTALAGPMLKWLLRREKSITLDSLLDARSCLANFKAATAFESIRLLSTAAAEKAKINPDEVLSAVMARESVMGTGIGHGIAVPHAKISNLRSPVLVVGTCQTGLEFEGVDDEPVRVVFLCLTAEGDALSQLQILAAIGQVSRAPNFFAEAVKAATATELLGVLRVMEQIQLKAK